MNSYTCDLNTLEAFLCGELTNVDETAFISHLDECEECRRVLEERAADEETWEEAESLLTGWRLHQSEDCQVHTIDQSPHQEAPFQSVLAILTPSDDPHMLGRLGTYEVSGIVGSGGMGVVLKSHDPSLDRIVAIKVMAPHLATSGSARKRFAREAKAAAAVLHPNVIAIHGVSNEATLPYLVMPYVRGESLQKRLNRLGALPTNEILRIAAQVAAGLAAAHSQGLVHRDIKPANILLEDGVERVAITDFGLARAVDDASMTRSGAIAGTPQYMSPEQARGETITVRSDQFALGSVVYSMCTGRAPFRAETTFGVIQRINNEEPRAIRDLNPEVPDWLVLIVNKLMQKQSENRFESADEVAELFEGCLAHTQQPELVPLPEKIQQLRKEHSGADGVFNKVGVISMITLAVSVIGILGFFLNPGAEESTKQTSAATVASGQHGDTQFLLTGSVLSPDGKPIPNARVEVTSHKDRGVGTGSPTPFALPPQEPTQRYLAKAGGDGQFELKLPRSTSSRKQQIAVIASAPEFASRVELVDDRLAKQTLELKLFEPREVRMQIVDTAGNSIPGVSPRITVVFRNDGYSLAPHRRGDTTVGWPTFTPSGKDGVCVASLPKNASDIDIEVSDKRFAGNATRVQVDKDEFTFLVQPKIELKGTVIDEENGEPVPGASVSMVEYPISPVTTDSNGQFSLLRGERVSRVLFEDHETVLRVYPPEGSPYLFYAKVWRWPNEGMVDTSTTVKLKRGIMIRGQVVEEQSGRPIVGARLRFEPQLENNPYIESQTDDVRARTFGHMDYFSGADGQFSLPVSPGPGYLLVDGSTMDFVHQEITDGDLRYGKRGLRRRYYHAARKLSLKRSANPKPLQIELKRGKTLSLKVNRPDGTPAQAQAYAKSYLVHRNDARNLGPIPISDGVLLLPGYDPQSSLPLILVDRENGSGLVVDDPAELRDGGSIQLLPTGTVKAQFVTNDGKPKPNHRTGSPALILTPGAGKARLLPDQPVAADSLRWSHVAHLERIPSADKNGIVDFDGLLPNGTYRFRDVGSSGWELHREFKVESGKTIDLGKVVLPERS